MDIGHYGWSTNIKVFQQHPSFITLPSPPTPDHGVLNLGDAPFDGISPGHFVGYSGGTYLAINASSDFSGNFIDFHTVGSATKFRVTFSGIIDIFNTLSQETTIGPTHTTISDANYNLLLRSDEVRLGSDSGYELDLSCILLDIYDSGGNETLVNSGSVFITDILGNQSILSNNFLEFDNSDGSFSYLNPTSIVIIDNFNIADIRWSANYGIGIASQYGASFYFVQTDSSSNTLAAGTLEAISSGVTLAGNAVKKLSSPGDYTYGTANPATRIYQGNDGTIHLQTAPSGAAGTTISTWNDALVVNADTSVHAYSDLTVDGTLTAAGLISSGSLPLATTSTVGAVKIGRSLLVDSAGLLRVGSVDADQVTSVAPGVIAPGIVSGQITSLVSTKVTGTLISLTAPSEITVTGSPVSQGGTVALTWASETQHFVFAAPSGSSGTPGFRALVASDIPALSYVTSVAMTVPADFGISGSPVTSSGTLGLTWNAQTGNVVVASPAGGGSGTPTFRSLVAADIPSLDASKITTGQLALAQGGTAVDNTSVAANKVFSSPDGSTGSAGFRVLRANDSPDILALFWMDMVV